jgi:hypothetical protein
VALLEVGAGAHVHQQRVLAVDQRGQAGRIDRLEAAGEARKLVVDDGYGQAGQYHDQYLVLAGEGD